MDDRTLGNKYRIIERLGRGGMAEVFRAHHINLDRQVAIKILHDFLADDPEFKTRFEKEARNIARLKHPNIIQVYDFEFDIDNESYYMVMELVDGINVKDRLNDIENTGQPIDLAEALSIIRQSASALAYAHQAGMIHRDVKPANLLLDRTENNRVVLTDFGIAKMITSAQYTITGGIIGTPAYMAPEQGVGETGDERSDLYSLGVILFQMVTGELPYEADTPLALILKHLNEPIPIASAINPQLNEKVDALINKLLAKAPDDRFQTADALIVAIDKLTNVALPADQRAVVKAPVSIHTEQTAEQIGEKRDSHTLDGSTQPAPPPQLKRAGQVTEKISKPITERPKQKQAESTQTSDTNGLWLWTLGILGTVIILVGGYILGATNGVFPAVAFLASETPMTVTLTETVTNTPTITETPTEDEAAVDETAIGAAIDSATETSTSTETATATSTQTATQTATATTSHTPDPTDTSTAAPTNTPVPTRTLTATQSPTPDVPSNTPRPSVTSSITPNVTATIAQQRTATYSACTFDYAIIEQTPLDGEEGGFFTINSDYERTITLLNTGTCAWEVNTSLSFINGSGESFDAGPRVFIREVVDVGQEYDLLFEGTLPARGSTTPYSGQWQLRTPGQLTIGEPITISVMVFDPG